MDKVSEKRVEKNLKEGKLLKNAFFTSAKKKQGLVELVDDLFVDENNFRPADEWTTF